MQTKMIVHKDTAYAMLAMDRLGLDPNVWLAQPAMCCVPAYQFDAIVLLWQPQRASSEARFMAFDDWARHLQTRVRPGGSFSSLYVPD
jgi:hypothetical protein